MDVAGSFGAGRSGSTIDPYTFAKQPQTILRVLSWIFSLVVFASIVNEGYVNLGSERLHCVFNKNEDACNYGVFLGLVGLLACSFFFMLDYKFSSISSVKDRKKAIMLDIGFSGVWTFMYFVSFCFLANQWSRTKDGDLPLNQGADAARAAIAFSFFSIVTWAGLTVRSVQRYLLGTDMTLFTTEHMDGGAPTQPYPSNSPVGGGGAETSETYQSPPFTENTAAAAAPTYQVPIY
ncbi:synaptogyrin-3a [Pseudoliparis swirei]|uniref:synaptogyrin-3a n=1 Tax=Pseudoliparis swirei TaxID=2059687 RepID=UPI0024BEF369|nr:synaptogyrin-3a [Pseudoliparis swirei]